MQNLAIAVGIGLLIGAIGGTSVTAALYRGQIARDKLAATEAVLKAVNENSDKLLREGEKRATIQTVLDRTYAANRRLRLTLPTCQTDPATTTASGVASAGNISTERQRLLDEISAGLVTDAYECDTIVEDYRVIQNWWR